MRQVFLCEFSTHYMMGDSIATIRFTPKQFEQMLELKKLAETDDDAFDEMDAQVGALEKATKETLYALSCVPYSEMFGKKSPKQVISILKRGKTVSDEWEEGSFAFATTKPKAQDAIRKIEAKHIGDNW